MPLIITDQIPQEEERVLSPPSLLSLGSLPPTSFPSTPQRRRQDRDRERRHSNLSCNFSLSTYRKQEAANGNGTIGSSSTPSTPSKFRFLLRDFTIISYWFAVKFNIFCFVIRSLMDSPPRRAVADGCRAGTQRWCRNTFLSVGLWVVNLFIGSITL